MADNNFKGTVEALFQGMEGVVSSKTVVGDAIHIGDTIILPLVDVSFGMGAGAFKGDAKEKGGGGIGGKITPCAVLVIQNGKTRLVNNHHHSDHPLHGRSRKALRPDRHHEKRTPSGGWHRQGTDAEGRRTQL